MTNHNNTDAEAVLDHVASHLEAKLRPTRPIRTYTVRPDGWCRLDLPEVRIRLDQVIDQLPKHWQAE